MQQFFKTIVQMGVNPSGLGSFRPQFFETCVKSLLLTIEIFIIIIIIIIIIIKLSSSERLLTFMLGR